MKVVAKTSLWYSMADMKKKALPRSTGGDLQPTPALVLTGDYCTFCTVSTKNRSQHISLLPATGELPAEPLSFRGDLDGEHSVAHGYFTKLPVSSKAMGGLSGSASPIRFYYSISSLAMLRLWWFSAENQWVLQSCLQLHQSPPSAFRVLYGWLDYYNDDMWNVLWVNEEESGGSWSDVVYTSELNLQWKSPCRRYAHEQQQDIVAFQLSPHRRVANSLRCLSRGSQRSYVYKDRRLYHLFGVDDAGSAVVDCYDLDLGNMQRMALPNHNIKTAHFVPYHDQSLSQAYILGLRGNDGPLWYHRFQLLHTNDSLQCLWLNERTQRLERYPVTLPATSFWSVRMAALKRKGSKYTNMPAAGQWWSQAKPSILSHSNRFVYLLLYFPLLGHIELARFPIPHSEHGRWSALPLEVLPLVVSTDIAPNVSEDSTTGGFVPFQFDSSATMPSAAVLHRALHHASVAQEEDDVVLREADLTYHLRSMRPWRVLDAQRLHLPILLPCAAASTIHPSELSCVFLEFQWQPLHLENHHSLGHLYHRDLLQHFGFFSEILDNVFAIATHVAPSSMIDSAAFSECTESHMVHDATDVVFSSSSPVKATTSGRPETGSVFDHLAFYRQQRASSDNLPLSSEESTVLTSLVHPGEALLSLMRQAGLLEHRVVAQRAYIRPPRRGAAVSVWEAAKSWVPVQYDWFVHVPTVTVVMPPAVIDVLQAITGYVRTSRLFTTPSGGFSTPAPITDDVNSSWTYVIPSDVLGHAMGSSTRHAQASSSLWERSWIDTLPLPTLCPAATTPSTVSAVTLATVAPEVMLLMVSACHRYPARRLFYPALWTTELLQRLTPQSTSLTRTTTRLSAQHQYLSDEPTSTDERYQRVIHPVISVFAYLLYHRRPSATATTDADPVIAELETPERGGHHSPETLYEVMTLTLQAQQSLLVHDLAIIREEEAAGRRSANPAEHRWARETVVGQEAMPSAGEDSKNTTNDEGDGDGEESDIGDDEDDASFMQSVASIDDADEHSTHPQPSSASAMTIAASAGRIAPAVTEAVPLHQLEWSQWWNLLAQPHVVPVASAPPLSAVISQSQQSPPDSDRSDNEADAIENGSSTSSSTVDDNDVDSNSDRHSDEEDLDESSVHRVHREDGHHLRRLLHHAVLTAFHAHFTAVSSASSSSSSSSSSLSPQAQDASSVSNDRLAASQRAVLQRLMLHCHYPQSTYWSDFAHVLHVEGQHATLYRWALRACFVSNAYDELRLRRDEDFDPALCGAWVRFVTIPAEASVFWRRYASLTGLPDVERLPQEVIVEESSDGGRVVCVVHTALEAPPTAVQVWHRLQRQSRWQHQSRGHRQRQCVEIFILTLRMLFVRLYEANDAEDSLAIEERIVTLLQLCPRVLIAGFSHHRHHQRAAPLASDGRQHLWHVVRQCLPMAPLSVTETRASQWQRRVLEIEQTVYDEEHVDYLLTCSV